MYELKASSDGALSGRAGRAAGAHARVSYRFGCTKGRLGGGGVNRLRAVLVMVSALAAALLAADGQYAPALLLGVGIVTHGALWIHLRRSRRLGD